MAAGTTSEAPTRLIFETNQVSKLGPQRQAASGPVSKLLPSRPDPLRPQRIAGQQYDPR